jgi:D-glycero-D-manno-heptose 1,7-bisphosphate phosphatase
MKKGIFLDRDGTIIKDQIYLNDPAEIYYLPRVWEGLRLLRDMGFHFYIATNQSGVARGLVDIENLYAIHDQIRADAAREGIDFEGFYYAPYAVVTNHYMRKPNPGMLITAAREHGVDLKQSWMIGDRSTDIEAGHNAGTRAIFLEVDHRLEALARPPEAVCKDLVEAAEFIRKNL